MKKPWYIPLIVLSLAGSGLQTARASQFDQVMSVGADSISVRTNKKAGFKVTDIDIDGKRTTEKPGNVVVYHVQSLTTITVDGLPSKVSDIHPGMRVAVVAGLTPTDADSIVANTVPPPVPKPKGTPVPKGKGKPPKQAFRKITEDKVLAIRPDRITVGQNGAQSATAYLITPVTAITVNGKKATVADIRTGMNVHINAGAQSTAASIDAANLLDQ